MSDLTAVSFYIFIFDVCELRGNVITGSWTGRPSLCTRVRAAPNTTRLDSQPTNHCCFSCFENVKHSPTPALSPPVRQEISLSEVLHVRGPTQLSMPLLPGHSAHSFEVVTASLVYCVVAGDQGLAWETVIRQALMPVQSSGEHSKEDHSEWETATSISSDGSEKMFLNTFYVVT